MDLLATLHRSGGVDALARHLSETPVRVSEGIEALLPAMMTTMRDAVREAGGGEQGVGALIEIFDRAGDGALAQQVMLERPVDPAVGEALLMQICPHNNDSRAVAARLAEQDPAIDRELLARILPLLAMLVAGYMSAQVAGSALTGKGGPRSLGMLYADLTA